MLRNLDVGPHAFDAIWYDRKQYEILPDSEVSVGDELRIKEFDVLGRRHTGRWVSVRVTYGSYGLKDGLPMNTAVISFVKLAQGEIPIPAAALTPKPRDPGRPGRTWLRPARRSRASATTSRAE